MERTVTVVGQVRDALGDLGFPLGWLSFPPAHGSLSSNISNTEIRATPLVIARCHSVDDIVHVLMAAGQLSLPVAVRGGGYSPAGLGTVEGGIVADVSALDEIVVDPATRTVRVGAGVLSGDLEQALAAHGLAMTIPVPSRAGVVGAALSGGVGVLVRKLGYVSDAIIGATVVTGLAEVEVVDERDVSGLFWGIKGGGGNFGIVAELEFRCVELPELATTQLVFGEESLAAALAFYRDWTVGLPEDITAVAMLRAVPAIPGVPEDRVGRPGLVLTVIHADPARAAVDLTGLADAPTAIFAHSFTGSPGELRVAMERGFPHDTFGAVIRSGWTDTIDDVGIADIVELARAVPSRHSLIEVVRMGGAVRTMADPGSAPGRDAEFLLNAMALWTEPDDASASRDWSARSAGVVHSVADSPALAPGFVSHDELDQAATSYGAHYERLRDLKTSFDPSNLLRRNLNIQPRSTQ
ncbi:FAD-binding oxidoreductase [Lysinimonas soli]|uniref:FAD-binding oxidoreductase n=1 Tax=Lysinimonas soli TaxID=1074233 RepID=A0ABW0NLR2_9MICO